MTGKPAADKVQPKAMVELRKKTIESWPTGEQVMEIVKEKFGTRVILAFSRGKDSIGCWLALRDAGFEVIPYHNMLCPGMAFVEESLDYFERFFGVHIRRVPHPTLYAHLNDRIFQTPATAAVIAGAKLPYFDSSLTEGEIATEEGLPDGAMTAIGIRVHDNLMRRMWLVSQGPLHWKTRRFAPVWDWRKGRLMAAIEAAGIVLPPDYALFGRSFDSVTLKYLWQIKRNFPADYRVILEWMPLAEAELWRYEKYGRAKEAAPAEETDA